MGKFGLVPTWFYYGLLLMPMLVALGVLVLPRVLRWLDLVFASGALGAVLTIVALSNRTYIGMVRPDGNFFLIKPTVLAWVVLALVCVLFMSTLAWACKSEYEPD